MRPAPLPYRPESFAIQGKPQPAIGRQATPPYLSRPALPPVHRPAPPQAPMWPPPPAPAIAAIQPARVAGPSAPAGHLLPKRVVQRYDIKKVYTRIKEAVPADDVLADLQIIHNTLNNKSPKGPFMQYLQFLNEQIERRGKTYGWTPMESLALSLGPVGKWKHSKIFESASEAGILGHIKTTDGRFHDVSAGLHHGEYEHALQTDFIRNMYKYRHLYGGTGLSTSYDAVLGAMTDVKYMVSVNGRLLSLWDIVMDIQGGFISNPGKRMEQGINPLFREEEGDQYKKEEERIFGTSATVLHYAFGAGTDVSLGKTYPGVEKGELAVEFPYLAEAIWNRAAKRTDEEIGKFPKQSYKTVGFSGSQKLERRTKIQNSLGLLTSGKKNYTPIEWRLKESTKASESSPVRKNVFV
jgi:hypothetical protein